MLHFRFVALLAIALIAGCTRDLDVPAPLQRGGVSGVIDTQRFAPLGGNAVRLIQASNGARYEVSTNDTGAFSFGDLPPGSYLLQADLTGFAPLREGPFQVSSGAPNDLGTFQPTWLSQTPSDGLVTGTVAVNGGPSGPDAGLHPSDALGATVAFLLETNGMTKVNEVTVNAFGAYTARMPPGIYTLQATHPYYVAASRSSVEVLPNEHKELSSDPLVMELNPAELSGEIHLEVDAQETTQPAVGVTIFADTGVSAVTDSMGRFTLGGLAAGTRTFRLSKSGYHDAQETRSVTFAAAEQKVLPAVTLLLDRGDLTGEVEMSDGTPLQQVTVDVPGLPYATSVSPTPSNPSRGRFVLNGLPLGSYNVRAARPNYVSAQSTTVTVRANVPVDIGTLRLTRIQGDFAIDDGDNTNTPGYTRRANVTLVLSNAANAAQYRVAEGSAAALSSATYQPFTSSSIAYTLSSGEGLKEVYLQFRDAANSESPPLSSTVVLDTTAPSNPSVQIQGGAGFTRTANPLPLTLTANDSGSGIVFVRLSTVSTVDANGDLTNPRQSYLRDLSFTRPTSADGAQSVYAQFIDNAGNVSAVVSSSIVIDTAAPTGTVTITRGAKATVDGYTNSLLVELNETPGGVEPNGGFLQIRIANDAADLGTAVLQPMKPHASWLLDPQGEGIKSVHYQFVDAAGNASAAGVVTIRYDVTAPLVTATLSSASPTNLASATLGFAVVEDNALSPTEGLTLSENVAFTGATPAAYPSTNAATFSLSTGDGTKTVYARVRDAAGNDGTANVSVTLDQTPPSGLSMLVTGTLADGTPSSTLSSSTNVTVTVSHTGATGILFAASFASCPATGYSALTSNTLSNQPLPGSGTTRTLAACFTDAAGNTAGPVSASIDVDAVSPTGCALVLGGRRADGSTTTLDKTALKDVTFTLTTCADAPTEITLTESTVSCTATANLSWLPYDGSAVNTYTLSAIDGPKTVRGCVRDRARNTSSFTADTLTLDTTPPSAASVSIDTGAAYVNLATKTSRGGTNLVNVSGSATGATQWAIAEAATPSSFSAISGTTFTFSSGDGVKTIRALFSDDLGNVTPVEATDSIEFDTVPPTATSLSISGVLADGTSSEIVTTTTTVSASVVQTGGTGIIFDPAFTTCPTSGYQTYSGGTISTTLGGSGTTRTVKACLSDAAGNTAGPVSDTIDLDTTVPSGCTLVMSGKRADGTATALDKTAIREVSYTLTGCVGETPTEIGLTEGTVTCTNGVALDWKPYVAGSASTTLSAVDGSKTVRGCVRDRARNVGSLTSDDITLDQTPPQTATVSIDTGAAYINASQVTSRGGTIGSISGSATGAAEWAISETAVPSSYVGIATNPRNFTFTTGDGVKTIRALFRDDVGNTTSLEVTDTIEFDTTAPTLTSISITGALADGTASDVVTSSAAVSVAVTQSGGTNIVFDPTFTTCPTSGYSAFSGGTVTTTLGGSGTTRTLKACVSDAAGNTAGPVSDTIDLDTSVPTGCTLVMSGKRADGSATALDKTAIREVSYTLTSCVGDAPTEIGLVESTVTCTTGVSLDWKPYVTGSSTYTLSSLDGSKTVRGCVRDRARNVGSLTSDDITLDQTPPQTATVSIDTGAAYVNAAQVTSRGGTIASISGSATGASEWAISETAVPASYVGIATNPRNFTFTTGDGVKTIRALFRDDVGNTTSLEVTDTIEFDTAPPTLSTIAVTGTLADGTVSDVVTTSTTVSVAVAQTGGTGIVFDPTFTTCPTTGYQAFPGGTVSTTLGGTGTTRTLKACISDAAGNTAGPASDTIDLDTSVPTGCTLVMSGKRADGSATALDKTAIREVSYTLSSCVGDVPTEIGLTEGTVTCTTGVSLDWKPYVAGSATTTLSAVDGTKTVRGCVRDRARNVGSVTSDDITLDQTPPQTATVSIDTGAAYVNAAQVTSRGGTIASVSGSATGAAEWAISETAVPSSYVGIATNPRNFTFTTGDGLKTIRALFRDDVGNTTSLEVTDTIEFDTAPPTLTSISITGALADGTVSDVVTSTTAVTISVAQVGATQLFIGAQTGTCPAVPYTTYASGTVAHTLSGSGARACIADAAGNVVGPVTDTITVDSTAPGSCALTIQGFTASGAATSGGQANLTATRDVTVSLGSCLETPTQIYLTEGTVTCSTTALLDWRTYTPGMSLALTSADGPKTVRGCVRDAALNVGSFALDDITLDATAPSASSTVIIDTGAPYVNRAQVVSRGGNIASVLASSTGATEWAIGESPNPSSFVAITTNPQNFTFSTGDGTKTIYAAFRDALGNTTTATIRDDITFDTAAPVVTGVTVVAEGPTQNEYTNTQAITVRVTNAPSDAASAKLAQATSNANCVDADLATAATQAVVNSYAVVLSPTDGLKRVCVQWLDAAGNPSDLGFTPAASEPYADTITLDRVPPTTPQITTSDQTLPLAHNAVFNVTIASASTDTNFSGYEKQGGQTTSWTSVTPSGLSFPFNVSNVSSPEAGVRNELRLRAVDLAGNVSGTSSVFITADDNPPDFNTTLIDEWIDNGDSKATLYWQASSSPDVRGYRVAYGSTPNNLAGTFAVQGASPIDNNSTATYFTLSGLPNNTITWVQVTPYDLAGNFGSASSVMAMQPGAVSPNGVATLVLNGSPLPDGGVTTDGGVGALGVFPARAANLGRWLYLAGTTPCTALASTSTCQTALQMVDMGGLESAIQRGAINPTPGLPVQSNTTLVFPTDNAVTQNGSPPLDLVVDGHLLFLASGRFLHILNLHNPGAPTSLADIDFSTLNADYRINTVQVLGDKLVVFGRVATGATTVVAAVVDIADLYDNSAATRPTTADVQHFTNAFSSYSSGFVTRDRFVSLTVASSTQVTRLADALTGGVWNTADVQAPSSGFVYVATRPPASGNLVYLASSLTGFSVFDIATVWTSSALGASTLTTATAFYAQGQYDVRGDQVFLPDGDSDGLRVLDTSDLSNVREVGLYGSNLSPVITQTWGNYGVLVSTVGGPTRASLRFVELATPRALSVHSTAVGAGAEIEVRPGFVYTDQNNIFDLHAGSVPQRLTSGGPAFVCSTHSAWFDDVEVAAAGTTLAVRELDMWTDRDSNTPLPDGGASSLAYSVNLPSHIRVSGVASWGNYLVAAEVRDAGVSNSGVWLEVFNASHLRDQVDATQLTTADSVASLQVVSTTTNLGPMNLDVTMNDGRAAVSIDDRLNAATGAVGSNVYIVDLRSAFDDNNGTNLGATSIQGVLTVPPTRRTVIQGNYAYLATQASASISPTTRYGFMVFDVTNAVDNTVGTTTVTGTPAAQLLGDTPVDSLTVRGSTAFLSPGSGTGSGVFTIDIANPLSPLVQGYYAMAPPTSSCFPPGDPISRIRRSGVAVAGSRLYITTGGNTLRVMNLE